MSENSGLASIAQYKTIVCARCEIVDTGVRVCVCMCVHARVCAHACASECACACASACVKMVDLLVNRRDGVVVRASASQSVDLGFIPFVKSYQKT